VWPILFELSVELSYPMPEGTTGALVMISSNIFSLVFIYMSDGISPIIFTWIVPLLLFLFAFVFLLVKMTYKRIKADTYSIYEYHQIQTNSDNTNTQIIDSVVE